MATRHPYPGMGLHADKRFFCSRCQARIETFLEWCFWCQAILCWDCWSIYGHCGHRDAVRMLEQWAVANANVARRVTKKVRKA